MTGNDMELVDRAPARVAAGTGLRVLIFGSCVTRDLFDVDLPAVRGAQVATYLARTTLASVIAPPVDRATLGPMAHDLAAGFDGRRFEHDLHKRHFELVGAADADLAMIDLIDERHGTAYVGEGALAYTKIAAQYVDPLLAQGAARLLNPLSRVGRDTIGDIAHRFAARFTDAWRGPVVVHRARYASRYIDEHGDVREFDGVKGEQVRNWNAYLETAYDALLGALGGRASVLEVPREHTFAGGEHRWDLTPFHYDRGYYDALASRLAELVR